MLIVERGDSVHQTLSRAVMLARHFNGRLHLVLAEEVRRSGGDLTQLAAWRRQRWGSRVEQQFVLQRQRFQRISFYQLVLKERGEAMEYYYQLSNQDTISDPQPIHL